MKKYYLSAIQFGNITAMVKLGKYYKDLKNTNYSLTPEKYDEHLMTIRTDNVLGMIQKGVGDWEKMVPTSVAKQIKENHLFGYTNH